MSDTSQPDWPNMFAKGGRVEENDPVWKDITPKIRFLDPVRAAALHEAVRAVSWDMDDAERHAAIIATAERFLAWLAGPEAE
jgi:hypothetical protein